MSAAEAPALSITATRTGRGTKAKITATIALPDGTVVVQTLGGNRADRAAAVWAVADPDGTRIVNAGTLADAKAAEREATKWLRGWSKTYRGSTYTVEFEARPAGWTLVTDEVAR